jgi:hypothetical protein
MKTTPGLCTADITDIRKKIKAREDRCNQLEMEIFHIREKIIIMKHEIDELFKDLRKEEEKS